MLSPSEAGWGLGSNVIGEGSGTLALLRGGRNLSLGLGLKQELGELACPPREKPGLTKPGILGERKEAHLRSCGHRSETSRSGFIMLRVCLRNSIKWSWASDTLGHVTEADPKPSLWKEPRGPRAHGPPAWQDLLELTNVHHTQPQGQSPLIHGTSGWRC